MSRRSTLAKRAKRTFAALSFWKSPWEWMARSRAPRVLRSIPLLDDAALEAVRQWQYQPVLMNGNPVPVIMTVLVPFSM
jgi:hypothetical protein